MVGTAYINDPVVRRWIWRAANALESWVSTDWVPGDALEPPCIDALCHPAGDGECWHGGPALWRARRYTPYTGLSSRAAARGAAACHVLVSFASLIEDLPPWKLWNGARAFESEPGPPASVRVRAWTAMRLTADPALAPLRDQFGGTGTPWAPVGRHWAWASCAAAGDLGPVGVASVLCGTVCCA